MAKSSRNLHGKSQPRQYKLVREAIAISGVFMALMLTLIIASYDPQDPSSFYASSEHQLGNLAGYLGAWVASYLYYFLGYSAFFLPLLFLLAAFRTFTANNDSNYIKLIKWLSGLLLMLSLSGLLTLQNWRLEGLPATAGGVVGIVIANNTFDLLGNFAANLLLLFLVVISISLSTGLSWLQIFEVVGGAAIYVAMYLVNKINLKQVRQLPLLPARSALEVLTRRPLAKTPTTREARGMGAATGSDGASKLPAQLLQELGQVDGKRVDPKFVFMPGESEIANRLEETEKLSMATEQQVPPTTEPATDIAEVSNQKVPKVPKLTPRIINNSTAVATRDDSKDTPPATAPQTSDANSNSGSYSLPSLSLLNPQTQSSSAVSDDDLTKMGKTLVSTLKDFGLTVKLLGYSPGPVVTMFEIQPAAGIKAARISNLANDLSRTLAVGNVRVVEFISGKSCIGIEVPNSKRQMVNFRSLLESQEFNDSSLLLPMALGSDILGKTIIADLASMPHLLVAGTTGSGKSIGINTMIISLLYKYKPQDLRLIMIDPKMLELASYNDIPNLLTPVITDMNLAAKSIGWCVNEMECRYKLMAGFGARNIQSYNQEVKAKTNTSANEELKTLPYIVIVIDEYADMIMVNRKVEDHLVRLAQKARAAGIHIILATQRPSVDVITGLIKANIPARISYKASSRIDSRTILDQSGAEQLLGKGDMLYMSSGGDIAKRVHGAFIPDESINKVTVHCRQQGTPEYKQEVFAAVAAGEKPSTAGDSENKDELYDEAVEFITENQRVSISSLQRKFKIGYNRAARIIEFMEEKGVVSSMDNAGKRSVLS